jgi:2-polyprenyl-3-methyl-5-hydroxy-6-metoxy-1,4-benzoquinol methylase
MTSMLEAEAHFAFGENWRSFVQLLDEKRIQEAVAGMRRLFPAGELQGAHFLDIGCGSGLSSLAAIRLGAAKIDAVDIDSNSVATTTEVLSRFVPAECWSATVESVFNLNTTKRPLYDVVYSWGVLHHTGDMWRAIDVAASMVKPGGQLAIALYMATPACGFWTREKKFYSRAPGIVQAAIRMLYKSAWALNTVLHGRNPLAIIRNYHSNRGMDWSHDVHDWLGGFPYESASPEQVQDFLGQRGFRIVREFLLPPGRGTFGTGCNEFVAVRAGGSPSANSA